MADKSKIEWTDASWNPIRARNKQTGKIGWHCEHATTGCYAENFNQRLGTRLPFKPGHRDDIELFLDEQILTQPLRWKRSRKIFVGSMTDVFADFVPDAWLDRMFAVMALSPRHTFQVLTKRAKRMRDYVAEPGRFAYVAGAPVADCIGIPVHWPLPNVWLGVSAERQREANERIPELMATPAAVRFISAEPLLGPIDLDGVKFTLMPGFFGGALGWHHQPYANRVVKYPSLDWVIAGGESGSQARPMHPDWVRDLRDQCAAAGTAFFFKQWGEWADAEDYSSEMQERLQLIGRADGNTVRVGKQRAGRVLDGKTHSEFPTARE
jgi:protein gp37